MARSIRSARAQRRKGELDDVQAKQQVVAELSGGDGGVEVAVGRRDQPDVGAARAVLTDAFVAPFLEEAQQFRLEQERKVADLVEEQRPSLGRGDLSLGVGDRAGERAARVAEELAFEQVGTQARAAHGDKRTAHPAAPGMDGPREDPFAGPTFSPDQDHGIGRRDLAALFQNRADLRVAGSRARTRARRPRSALAGRRSGFATTACARIVRGPPGSARA